MRCKFLTVVNVTVFSVYREDGGRQQVLPKCEYLSANTSSQSGRYIHFENVRMKRVDIKIVKVSRGLCKKINQ
jgi:hypothetical protein